MINEFLKYLSVLSGFLTPMIAVLAVIIAYRQFRIQQYRVRMDLFDRRLVIYNAIMSFMRYVQQHEDASIDQIYDFINQTTDCKFLFKGEIKEHIDVLLKKALDLREINATLSNCNKLVDEEKTRLVKENTAIYKSIREQYNRTDELFLKYLKLF